MPPRWLRTAQAFTRSTSRSPDAPVAAASATLCTVVAQPTKLDAVVLFFEILLVACTVVITWFALYAVYRLISDDS